ncbi:F-box protein SKIP22 [Cardamine amara subsp. amara]|uniref:F-box protein SKIP22 n=1 Tax=Cardamine amara subsp. amara TaxID=228776 RepID=A0ABD1C0M5_CARAN
MKLRLRRHETRETLRFEFADSCTFNDLRRLINLTTPSSVHLSLNRKDELIASSPEDTLRSLGVTSGDLIYYSLDHSAFFASIQIGESSNWRMGDYETLAPQSEMNQALVHDSMGIGFAEVGIVPDQAKSDLNSGVEDLAEGSMGENSGMEGPEPMDVELVAAGSKRLSEPFFLKKILLEKSGDTSELTTLAMSVHAVMLESGFALFNSGSDKLSKELLSLSLRYTLPELLTSKDVNTIESITVKFQNLGSMVVVYGTLGGSSGKVRRIHLDKRRFVPVIDLVMDTLKFEKQSSSSAYREVFMFWRMVKDGFVIPLLMGLCDKAGLEPPPCLMRLPTELKLKILESLPGVSIGNMACVCTEMRYLASDNDLWKQKLFEEDRNQASTLTGEVNWKSKFGAFWRQKKRISNLGRRNLPIRRSSPRFPQIVGDPNDPRDPFSWLIGNPFGSIGIHPGQPGRALGGRAWGQRFSLRCNLGRRD